MRSGFVLAVVVFGFVPGLGGVTRTASAQTSIGFTHPDSMDALLSYRLPDWGYRTIFLELGLLGNGESISGCVACQEAISAVATEGLRLQWYHESEGRVWSLFGNQGGSWNWNQTHQEPEDAIESALSGRIAVGANNRSYLAGDFFLVGSASGNAAYQEARSDEGSIHQLLVSRDFSGSLNIGAGLGRMRDVTPVLQAQRLSERLQALGHQPLSQEDVLRLASVLAQGGGYREVFDRPNRQLWRDVLEPLVARGETLTPFEVYYLGDVFYEALGSRQEGFLIDLRGHVQRTTHDNRNTFGATYWGPRAGLAWSHNLSLDHQLSASLNASYLWLDYDNGGEGERGIGFLSLDHQWVVADRFLWSNSLSGRLLYNEVTAPVQRDISREKIARLLSVLSFYVEDHISMGPTADVSWRRQEFGENWTESWTWNLAFSITYDLENALF